MRRAFWRPAGAALMQVLMPVLLLALLLGLSACQQIPPLPLPEDVVQAGPALPVSGRQGWQFRRSLRFGAFETTPIGPGVVSIRRHACSACDRWRWWPGTEPYDGASSLSTSRLAFTQQGPDGLSLEVQADSRLAEQIKVWPSGWLGVRQGPAPTTTERSLSFAGTLQPAREGAPAWRFALWDETPQEVLPGVLGWLEDEQGRQLSITPLHAPQAAARRGSPWAGLGEDVRLGYRVEDADGRVLAAVQTFTGPGEVWLRADLPADLRLALAGLASALMLRPDLGRLGGP